MFVIFSLLLLPSPLLFQIIIGTKAMSNQIKLGFGIICLISFISQIVLSFTAFSITLADFQKGLAGDGSRCGMNLVGLGVIIFTFTFLLLLTMLVQYLIKRSSKKE